MKIFEKIREKKLNKLEAELLAMARESLGIVSIPIYGIKRSVNVGVAFGIAAQAWAASLLKR